MDEIVKEWLESYIEYNTKKAYRSGILLFLDFIGKSSEEYVKSLVKDSHAEEFEELLSRYGSVRRIVRALGKEVEKFYNTYAFKEDVERFVTYAKRQGKSSATINLYINAIRVFFRKMFLLTLSEDDWRDIRIKYKGGKVIEDEAGTPELWRAILMNMNPCYRSLFLFLLSSGCRISEALELKISDFDFDKDPPRAVIRAEYTKTNESRIVFFTNEAKEEILKWLKYRKTRKKRNGKSFEDERVWPVTDTSVRVALHNALDRARGLNSFKVYERERVISRRGKRRIEIWKRYKIHIHSARKFFRTYAVKGMNLDMVEQLMGHRGYLTEYRRHTVEELANEYKKAEPYLTIFKSSVQDIRKEMELIRIEDLDKILESVGVPIEKRLEVMKKVISRRYYIAEGEFNAQIISRGLDGLRYLDIETLKEIRIELMKLLKEGKNDRNTNNCPNQKIVDLDELESYLNSGWKFVSVLPNNKVVVEKVS